MRRSFAPHPIKALSKLNPHSQIEISADVADIASTNYDAAALTAVSRRKLGVFFSHPTQHHSAMFQYLAKNEDIDLHVFYYDPGSLGGMFDPGYETNTAWDVDVTQGTRHRVLKNLLRGREVHPFRQINPGVVWQVLLNDFDAIFLSGYASPSNWLVLLAARLKAAEIWYQSDTNILDMRRKKSSRAKNFLRRIFFRRVNKFLISGDNNKSAYEHFGIDEERMVWCPIPVDMQRYERAREDPQLTTKLNALRERYEIPKHAAVVAFCGKLIPRKRPQDLIKALRLLKRNDVYVLLIGSGEMRAELERELQPTDQIVITGFVNQSEIPYHMLLADIGVVSSEWDPHPLVTTEFAMCGLPIIVSDYCGVWGDHDILQPDKNGFVYPCGDVAALASMMSALLSNERLKAEMGATSLELARDQSAQHAAGVLAQLIRRA
jgi:glycosyltransferase involved in cell wall biosynthesis